MKKTFHSKFPDDSIQNTLVKCASDSFTFQSYHNIGRCVIKVGEFMCDVVYLNPFANLKQWYNHYVKKGKQLSV